MSKPGKWSLGGRAPEPAVFEDVKPADEKPTEEKAEKSATSKK